MSIRRVVPDIVSERLEESQAFFVDVLGFEVAMDMGWIVTLASPTVPSAQVTLFPAGESSSPAPDLTVEVDDVDRVHEGVVRAGHEIVYPLTDEEWGVRRFFVKDPGGTVVNVMKHLEE